MGNTVPSSFLEMNLTQTANGLLNCNNNNNNNNNDVDLNRQTRVNLTDDNSQCKSPLWVPPVTPYTLLGLLKPHLTQSGLLANNNQIQQQQTSSGTLMNTKLCEDSIGNQQFQSQQSSLKQSQQHISSMSAYLSELLNQSQTSMTATTTTSGKNSVHGEFKIVLLS
uniref:Fork-head domain-containing protein n=1 Tax=Schistosoma mansoni TaxID=6183 RepID=A0A5K4EZB2_SCHMA